MVIVGAKGFAKELLLTISDNGLSDFVFFDNISDKRDGCIFENYTVLATVEETKKYLAEVDNRFLLGIGKPAFREQLANEFTAWGAVLSSLISVKSSIGMYNNIAEGTIIQQAVVIENDNTIGKGCLIHTGSFVSHDVEIGNYCEVSPFVKLLGKVKIGNFCELGTGCIILPGVILGDNVIVGAGAVVTKDVKSNTTVMGIPAISKNTR